MLELGFVREHLDVIEKMARDRGVTLDLAPFRELDAERRKIITSTERMKADRNKASEEIAALKKSGGDAAPILARMKQVSDEIKRDDDRIAELDERMRNFLLTIPNIPHASVPVGHSVADNVEVRRSGQPPKFDFAPRPHWEIGERCGILDFEAAQKMSGARFAVYKGLGRPPRTRARQFFPRHSHPRARLHRNPAAVPGEYRRAHRRGPVAEVRGGHVPPGGHRPVAHADQRSRADQPLPR